MAGRPWTQMVSSSGMGAGGICALFSGMGAEGIGAASSGMGAVGICDVALVVEGRQCCLAGRQSYPLSALDNSRAFG